MILDFLSISLAGIALITAIINLIISIKKQERILILKDISIVCLSLTLIFTAIRFF